MIARRTFLKFIASAVVAKSLLDNVAVKAIESAGKASRQVLKVVSTAGFYVGCQITIAGVNCMDGMQRTFTVTQIDNGTDLVLA